MNPPGPTVPAPTLDALDARLDALPHGALTLAPTRSRATPLAALVQALARGDGALEEALASALGAVVEAQLDNFPDNLFWDLDFLASSLVSEARTKEAPAAFVRDASLVVVELMAIYGMRSPVRFQYVHDFTYGFDWAKWVRRSPDERRHVGPFDLEFLRYSERRGLELLALIARDDAEYPSLLDDRPRNVFRFSRDPADEILLLRDLAGRDLLPVEAFRIDASPRWDRPFAELRTERASALGIPRKSA